MTFSSALAHTPLQPLPAQAELLSALTDGQLEPEALAQMLKEDAPEAMLERWGTYHLIGNALRAPGKATELPGDAAFLSRLRLRLDQAEMPSQQPQPAPLPLVTQSRQAANDAVFRWKLAASFASLTAVCAVAWQIVGSPGGLQSQNELLARNNQQQQQQSAEVVATTAGPVLQGSRMQELLAAHRQYGGSPAVQLPGPFLRNAVFATDAQGR